MNGMSGPPSGAGAAERLATLRRTRQAQVVILGLVGSALAVTIWQSYASVAAGSHTAALGLGETFQHALGEAFRPGRITNESTLIAVLEEHWPQGLRCIVRLTPNAHVRQRVGTCDTPDSELPLLMARLRPGEVTPIGSRLRMLHRPPPPPPHRRSGPDMCRCRPRGAGRPRC